MSRCFGGMEMEFQIRQGQIMDAKAIYALNVKEMGYDYPIEKTEEKARGLLESGKDKIFVAVAGAPSLDTSTPAATMRYMPRI